MNQEIKVDIEEQEYLKNYDISKYDRPSIAVDMAIFTVTEEDDGTENYRKLPEKKLKLLMIKRGLPPFKDMWALPGGFCKKGETVYEAAARELKEETDTDSAYLELCNVFSEDGRDPRGWIISQSFMALVNYRGIHPRAGSDAWEAAWFDVKLKKSESSCIRKADTVETRTVYELTMEYNDIRLYAQVEETRLYKDYHESVQYELVQSEGIGFDHGKIITCILNRLRERVENDGKSVFDLMPEYFTLTDLQKTFEIILDKKLLAANFRRKISEYVQETDKVISGGGHRPAKMFKRNVEAFYKNNDSKEE